MPPASLRGKAQGSCRGRSHSRLARSAPQGASAASGLDCDPLRGKRIRARGGRPISLWKCRGIRRDPSGPLAKPGPEYPAGPWPSRNGGSMHSPEGPPRSAANSHGSQMAGGRARVRLDRGNNTPRLRRTSVIPRDRHKSRSRWGRLDAPWDAPQLHVAASDSGVPMGAHTPARRARWRLGRHQDGPPSSDPPRTRARRRGHGPHLQRIRRGVVTLG